MASSNSNERIDPATGEITEVPANSLVKQPTRFLAIARAYVIEDDGLYSAAGLDLIEIKKLKAAMEVSRIAEKRPHDIAAADVQRRYKEATDILDQAEATLKKAIDTYYRTKEQKRIADEAIARRAAELRRAQLEADAKSKADAARQETVRAQALLKVAAVAEANAAAVQQTATPPAATGELPLEPAAAPPLAETVAAAQAIASARSLHSEAQTAVAATTAVIIPTVAPTELPKGSYITGRWKARLMSLQDVVKHIAEHPEDIALIELNQSAANARAASQKEHMKIPGLESFRETSIGTRR